MATDINKYQTNYNKCPSCYLQIQDIKSYVNINLLTSENKSKYESFRVKICPTCKMEIECGWDIDYKDNVIPVKKCGCNVDWVGAFRQR